MMILYFSREAFFIHLWEAHLSINHSHRSHWKWRPEISPTIQVMWSRTLNAHGCVTMGMYFISRNYTLNGHDRKFYVMCILAQNFRSTVRATINLYMHYLPIQKCVWGLYYIRFTLAPRAPLLRVSVNRKSGLGASSYFTLTLALKDFQNLS